MSPSFSDPGQKAAQAAQQTQQLIEFQAFQRRQAIARRRTLGHGRLVASIFVVLLIVMALGVAVWFASHEFAQLHLHL